MNSDEYISSDRCHEEFVKKFGFNDFEEINHVAEAGVHCSGFNQMPAMDIEPTR
jgi:hypothetical protein